MGNRNTPVTLFNRFNGQHCHFVKCFFLTAKILDIAESSEMFRLLYQFRVIFSSQRWWCAVDAYPDLPSSIRLLSMNWTNAIHSRMSNESDEIKTYKSKLKQPNYNSLCKMINRWCPMNRTLTPVTAELLLLLVDLEINHKFPLPKFVRNITVGVTSIANMFRWTGKAATPPKTRLNLASKPYQSVRGLHDLNLNNMNKSESSKSTCVQSIFRCSKSSVYQSLFVWSLIILIDHCSPCCIQAACLKETLYYWSLMFPQLQPCCINCCFGRLDCHLHRCIYWRPPDLVVVHLQPEKCCAYDFLKLYYDTLIPIN